MSMISNAVITGGAFSSINDQRQVYISQTQKSALDRLQENVAHAAFHNSGQRYDPPKCHPNTRVAVRDKIENWALRKHPDTTDTSILWLSGAAGARKSAIAQTVAEDFHSRGLLAASFFFGRSDPTRNHARSLVSTIVYQLYSLLSPPEQSRILAVVDRDPLIFTKTFLAQLEALIVIPLQPLFENVFWSSINAPRLVIIDGLDECLDRGMQRDVLLMLSASVHHFHLPFIFLLASRPEHDIQALFSSPDFLPIHTRLFLDNTHHPHRDIKLFLRDQFEECRTIHPFRHMIPHDWPSEDIVDKLTRKSSGQFIYASVVAKYVKSSRHRPQHRLDVVLNLRPASRDHPFSELDALYTHILSGVDDIERVLDVLSFHIIFSNVSGIYIEDIERILRLDPGEVVIVLCDLTSVIGFQDDRFDTRKVRVKLLHASLADYLLDSARSKDYFINVVECSAKHAAACIQFLSYVQRGNPLLSVGRAMACFFLKCPSLELTDSLSHAIREFSISRLYSMLLGNGNMGSPRHFEVLNSHFLPAFFEFLQKSDSTKHLELYQHHQFEYDLFLRESMRSYSSKSPALSLFFALIAIHRKIPQAALHHLFRLFDTMRLDNQVRAIFWMDTDLNQFHRGYLSGFLLNRNRSQEFFAGPKLFCQAAKCCLLYLSDHTVLAQKASPQMSARLRARRQHTPWKWHRRLIRKDIRGPQETPWLWIRRRTGFSDIRRTLPGNIRLTRIIFRKANNFSFLHKPLIVPGQYESDPIVQHEVNSGKYHLALSFLNYFLPRASKLDELVHMCQTLTLASRSQEFPRKSSRARSHMQKYAAQWG